MPMNLKLKWDGGEIVLAGLANDIDLRELKTLAASKTNFDYDTISFWSGEIPPKEIIGDDNEKLKDIGVQSGTLLQIRIKQRPVIHNPPVKNNSKDEEKNEINKNLKNKNELISMIVEMGFPYKLAIQALDVTDGNIEHAIELCFQSDGQEMRQLESPKEEQANNIVVPPLPSPSPPRVLLIRTIDADNSCLFNALGYLLERKRNVAKKLRQVIADSVMSDPFTFHEAVLGKSTEEYCAWILSDETWGGEIELSILSKYYECEICCVDIQTLNRYIYGEELGNNKRVFLLYNGIHYDTIVENYENGKEEDDRTLFDVNDQSKIDEVIALARKLKEERKFVDLVGCTLKCMICGIGLKGQQGAIIHANVTGHQNFGQV